MFFGSKSNFIRLFVATTFRAWDDVVVFSGYIAVFSRKSSCDDMMIYEIIIH